MKKILDLAKSNLTIIYVLFFFLALIVHLIGLNQIGRTWDEEYKVDYGILGLNLFSSADFSLDKWDNGIEHPMVAKYVYGAAEQAEATFIKGPLGPTTLTQDDISRIQNGNYFIKGIEGNFYAFPYDYTYPRVLSALFNAAAVLLTVIIGGYLLGETWSFLAGIFLILTPRFIFLGQLVTFESLSVFLFCLTIVLFYKLLRTPEKLKLYILVGICSGLFFWTRYNNIIIFPFLAGWLGIHYYIYQQKNIFTWKLILIPVIAFFLGILIWPVTWYDFPKYLLASMQFHQGRLVGVSLYYWQYFFYTTPILLLAGFCVGIFFCLRERTYWSLILLWLVACTVVIYSIFCIPLGDTRYAVILYPAITIIAAYGYQHVLKGKFVLLLVVILVSMVFETVKAYPYYLDYYNQIAGGAKGAIAKHLDFSWWGEGQREAGFWLNDNAQQNAHVGLIVTPQYVFPVLRTDITVNQNATDKTTDDYVVVTYGRKLSNSFLSRYRTVYKVLSDGEPLVTVYKKIT